MSRLVTLKTPEKSNVLRFAHMTAHEEISKPFEYVIEMMSEQGSLDPNKLLGKKITAKLQLPEANQFRYFDGYVVQLAQRGVTSGDFVYRASVRPGLWFLTRSKTCRMFQDKTVPDIIKEVLGVYKEVLESKFTLSDTYPRVTYCVQYRESDFSFISRLMEREGIYYFFKHEEDKHTMVIADDYSAHSVAKGYDALPFLAAESQMRPEMEFVDSWELDCKIRSGAFVLEDFDFEKPSATLEVRKSTKRKHEHAQYEFYDYPGGYFESGEGNRYAKVRLEELQVTHEVAQGTSNARGISVGSLLNLKRHPRTDQNREYLVLSSDIEVEESQYESSTDGDTRFHCNFKVMPSAEPYRPPQYTPRPIVQGLQTAIVVGPKGNEIHTDKYGRVKVQFHWDRLAKGDETSSCWIRVAHQWAGKNWGMVSIPRVGQEVLVSFLEGDADRPIISGRVYNAEQMPPYALPANATQSGVKSRSSKGGAVSNCNEIRFEDKKGSEQLFIQAEKNQDIVVKNDETHDVGHDRTKSIGNNETTKVGVNRTESVGANEDIKIGANRSEKVTANETVSVGASRSVTVGASETKKVALQRTHLVGVNETIGVGGAQEIGIGGFQAIVVGAYQSTNVVGYQSTKVGANQSVDVVGPQSTKVGAARSVNVGAKQDVTIGANASMSIGADESRSVKSGRSTTIGKDDTLNVGKNLVISVGESITVKTGKASITMQKDGTITIQGKNITIKGTGEININASKNLVTKGQKILQN